MANTPESFGAPDREDGGEPRTASTRWAVIAAVIAVFIIAVDQLTKQWAIAALTDAGTVTVIDRALFWVLRYNPGAAFSFLSNATWVFTIISSVVAIVVALNLRRAQSLVWSIVGGLVLGGALGNLIDRFAREPGFAVGHVVDFIYTPWIVPAVYNGADIAVVSGMCLFLICVIFNIGFDGKRVPKHVPEAEGEGQHD